MLVTGERSELNGPFFHGVLDTFKMPFTPADFNSNFGPDGAVLFNRDNGATLGGQVYPGVGHLQYSLGVFRGLRSAGGGPNLENSLKYAGRLTYNFVNPEKNPGYYTQGTYIGTAGDILAIAVGETIRKKEPVHSLILPISPLVPPISCLRNHSVTTWTRACSRSTSRPLLPLQATASVHFAGSHTPCTVCICFRRRLGSGRSSPIGDILCSS